MKTRQASRSAAALAPMRLAALCLLALVSCSAVLVAAKPVNGTRTLVLFDRISQKDGFSVFLDTLAERGFDVTVAAATDASKVELFKFNTERQYDHLVLFSPKTESYANGISVATFIDFVNDGGNILLAGSTTISDTLRDLALEFSADFDEAPAAVFDHFHTHPQSPNAPSSKNPPIIKADNVIGAKAIVDPKLLDEKPVLFAGIGHRVTGRNPLAQVVLAGFPSTYSYEIATREDANHEWSVEGSPILGSAVALVSASQARNNARIVFAGSVDMFSDRLIKLDIAGHRSGNEDFITELTKWVFQEKGVLKIQRWAHHRANEVAQHGIYRIKDDLVYELEISEYHSDSWHPYDAKDIQFEAVMLDPYIRATLRPTPRPSSSSTSASSAAEPTSSHYSVGFKLPDHYGVFTFKVDYKRHGYSWQLVTDTVEVRPFRHTDYPRFLAVANPYYVNSFSMMIGFVLVSALWLYYVPKQTGKKAKVA